jgi:hypothetical protein
MLMRDPSPDSFSLDPIRQAPDARQLLDTAFRLAFFRRVADRALDVSWLQVMAVVAVSLLIPLVSALVTVGSDGRFTAYDLPGALFHVPVILVASVLLVELLRVARVSQLVMAGLLAWCAIDFLTLAAGIAVDEPGADVPGSVEFLQYVPVAWMSLAFARYVLSLAPASARRAGWVIAVCAFVLAVPLAGVNRERSLWSMDYSASPSQEGYPNAMAMAAASEETLYRQPELLQRSLDSLAPNRKGIVDLYFVGMAGYGHQDVFMREVDSVAALFRERFQAEGRTVKLINNPKTVLSTPIASATSLKATVNRIGEIMDKDEDVLVLFLTSHGTGDHKFSLELWPLQLKQITPAMLREILDGSGIRNRVVIISACYAGGFVKPLEDDHTLVIAAAAPDRNSFGCSNENDWTYFGKAYFDEALRKTSSFIEAFEMAKPVIEAREQQAKFDASRPQISIGSAIPAKLEQLERQLGTRGVN